MNDSDIIRIRPLDDKSDYSLWRFRVTAAISAKGLDKVFKSTNQTFSSGEADSSSSTAPAEQQQHVSSDNKMQASNIIVSSLGDHALRLVRTVIGDLEAMMDKLDKQFDSKTIASRISKMSELVSIRYTTIKDDIAKQIDLLAGIIEQLRAMGTTFDDALAIGILVASIDVTELMPATAAIKTLTDKDMKWEEISGRLIE